MKKSSFMKKMFPIMLDSPGIRAVGFGIPYWFFAFLLLPMFLSLTTADSRGQSYEIWMEIGYHILNCIVVVIFFASYLKEAFFLVQVHTKSVFAISGICAGLIVLIKIAAYLLSLLGGNKEFAISSLGLLVTNESDLLFYSTAVIGSKPLIGTLVLAVLAPITTSCLLYGCVFAQLATRRPWLAYVVMVLMLFVIRMASVFCFWPLADNLRIFVLQLPIHLICCWTYQKTDTIWTPILTLTFSNLAMAFVFLYFWGII